MLKPTLALLIAGSVFGSTGSHAGTAEQSFIDQYHMDAQIHQIPGDQMLSDQRLSDMFRAQSRRMTICRGDFIPDGYVITGTTVNFDCGSWQLAAQRQCLHSDRSSEERCIIQHLRRTSQPGVRRFCDYCQHLQSSL